MESIQMIDKDDLMWIRIQSVRKWKERGRTRKKKEKEEKEEEKEEEERRSRKQIGSVQMSVWNILWIHRSLSRHGKYQMGEKNKIIKIKK